MTRCLIALAVLSWLLSTWPSPAGAEQKTAPPANTQPGKEFPDLGNIHIKRLGDPHAPYNSDPPTSGPHMPGIAPWGFYRSPVPKEFQVHNLEDGGVLIQYHCPKDCPDLVKKLEGVFQKYKTRVEKENPSHDKDHPPASKYVHLIFAPYPDMDSRIALTAWTRLDKFNDFDEARIDRFIEAYIGIDHHSKK
jgi:hypothetical protein